MRILSNKKPTDGKKLSANLKHLYRYSSKVRRLIVLGLVATFLLPQSSYAASKSITGSAGQNLTISTNTVSNNSLIKVTGKYFDETIGIYLAICVIPKTGQVPTPCGGGVNKAGVGEGSFWISSNPPPYGVGLADPYKPGGRFTYQFRVVQKIGEFDCKKVKCAITVRADHLRSNDRSFDLFIPLTFK